MWVSYCRFNNTCITSICQLVSTPDYVTPGEGVRIGSRIGRIRRLESIKGGRPFLLGSCGVYDLAGRMLKGDVKGIVFVCWVSHRSGMP